MRRISPGHRRSPKLKFASTVFGLSSSPRRYQTDQITVGKDRYLQGAREACSGRRRQTVYSPTCDFNEPRFDLQDKRIVTWGQERNREGRFACWNEWTFRGRSGTLAEPDAAVRWFFETALSMGSATLIGRHADKGRQPSSRCLRCSSWWFDHIFVSRDFREFGVRTSRTCADARSVITARSSRRWSWPHNLPLHSDGRVGRYAPSRAHR